MTLSLAIALLVIGFVLLLKGADFLVDGAAAIATKMKISEIVIGLTLVAFGTSAPELVVNVVAAFKGNTGITFGNIVGSNIINILLILGIAGIIAPIKTPKNTVWKEIPFSLIAAIVLWILCNDKMLMTTNAELLSRKDGIILLSLFVLFLIYVFGIAKMEITDIPDIKTMTYRRATIYVLVGLIGLVIGGKMVVESAIDIATKFKVSEEFIGLTIVAIGTSLPELFTSAVAAYKGKPDIAIGNIVGSNIFNIFFIMGISAMIHPLAFPSVMNWDIAVLVAASLALFLTMFTGQRRTIDRWEATLFVVFYIGYTVYLCIRK